MRLRDAQYESLRRFENYVLLDSSTLFKKDYSETELKSLEKRIPFVSPIPNFDYNFPSFCFALATGVGKTRLLGASIYTLYKEKGYKNFFVIAPNKTIYEKFIREFDKRNEKYIFEGITDLPKFRVFSGEDFNKVNTKQSALWSEDFIIYIFNIDKFKSEERVLQVKKINEYLGESFYEYISNLPDLVVLMDESHKYKTPIAINAINGLKPVLGLEYTATPFTKIAENEKSGKFGNILYEYSLGVALAADNPVLKRPQLLFRRDFDYDSLPKKDLYDVLLSDGLDNHERIKARLETYFANENVDVEKRFLPLVLIVCEDIRHAIQVEKYMKREFLDGKYKNKSIRIHSTPKGNKELPREEKYDEDTEVEKLLELEKPGNTYEIVINVNKLGLGWDVKNGELNRLRVAYHSNFGKVINRAEAWLANIEVVEPPKKRMEGYILKADNKDKAIPIPIVEPSIDVNFTLKYFEPKVPARLEDIEIAIIVKDLATREEKEIDKIEEELKESPKEYILARLLELPRLRARELPALDKIVDKYLELLGKKRQRVSLENRVRIINDIYGQIKEKIGERTTITYKSTAEKVSYSDYEATFEKGFEEGCYEEWDDKETKRGLVAGYNKSIYKENVFDTRQERIVAKILEKDIEVIKWFRPYKKDNFSIVYEYKGDRHDYIPDFIAETKDNLYIIEPKKKGEIEEALVVDSEATKTQLRKKTEATLIWIKEMNKANKKKWTYLLIPHNRITSSVNTFKKLTNQAVNLNDVLSKWA